MSPSQVMFIQAIIDCYPDFANEYGLLGCAAFSFSMIVLAAGIYQLATAARGALRRLFGEVV